MPQIERATAYKMRIGDVLNSQQAIENERLNFVEFNGKQVIRVNIVANVIEKYVSEGARDNLNATSTSEVAIKKKYLALTIDDASGQIRIKVFGDDVERFINIAQGDSVMVIGMLRYYNNEIYINPEIIRVQDSRYLLVRKLELEKDAPKQVNKEEVKAVKEQIIDMIKKEEANGGIDMDKLIMGIKASPDMINQEIQKLIEEGLAYEPRPGKIRYLG